MPTNNLLFAVLGILLTFSVGCSGIVIDAPDVDASPAACTYTITSSLPPAPDCVQGDFVGHTQWAAYFRYTCPIACDLDAGEAW